MAHPSPGRARRSAAFSLATPRRCRDLPGATVDARDHTHGGPEHARPRGYLPGELVPVSNTPAQTPSGVPRMESGRPTALLKFFWVAAMGPRLPSMQESIPAVVVLPLEPVTAATGIRHVDL